MPKNVTVGSGDKSYFGYLCSIVGRTYEYGELLSYLNSVLFYSLVPNDDNRGADGEQLRDRYLDEVGPSWAPSLPNSPCTVLEMLIGVAFRLEFELLGGRFERSAGEWFWVLIDNLGLEWCDNLALERLGEAEKMAQIVENLLERRYSEDGEGGLFPLKSPRKDQRRVEIWYQMSAWVIENYPI